MQTKKTPRPTTMAVAFYLAIIQAHRPRRRIPVRLVRQVQDSINRNAGLTHERSVDARLSFRTAEKLKQQGVL